MKKLVLFLLFMTMTTFATAQNFRFDEMTYSPEKTTFKLFAPADAKSVKVRIYRGGLGGKALKTIKMQYVDGLWMATVKGDLLGRFYTFDMGH